jgi:hypothetical protein
MPALSDETRRAVKKRAKKIVDAPDWLASEKAKKNTEKQAMPFVVSASRTAVRAALPF